MICYLDSSALVKNYFDEPGSAQLREFITEAEVVGTAAVSRAEVVAAFAKAVRLGAVPREFAESARRMFQFDWRDLVGIEISESVIYRASDYAWEYGLRGYDSVQLAAAMAWQELLGFPLTMATFDARLWDAAVRVGLEPYPNDMRLLKA